MFPAGERKFMVICRITIASLFLVILAGGVVRSTGSGMGCPDWPKCFDRFVPPVNAGQLPADYRKKYVNGRTAKNERFAKTLDVLGYGDLAARTRSDRSILEPEEFNSAKTWTEYINRLIGAITGFLMIGCLGFSVVYLGKRKSIFYLSLLNLVIVGFQGWLGSIVVSTNLLAWVVNVHMLLAILIVGIAIYTYHVARTLRDQAFLPAKNWKYIQVAGAFCLLLTIFQVVTGTEVREQVDAIADAMNQLNRQVWVARVGFKFSLHRDIAAIVLLLNGFLVWLVMKNFSAGTEQNRYAMITGSILLAQVLTGVCLAYFSLPGFAQAAHVTLAAGLFAVQLYLLLLLSPRTAHIKIA